MFSCFAPNLLLACEPLCIPNVRSSSNLCPSRSDRASLDCCRSPRGHELQGALPRDPPTIPYSYRSRIGGTRGHALRQRGPRTLTHFAFRGNAPLTTSFPYGRESTFAFCRCFPLFLSSSSNLRAPTRCGACAFPPCRRPRVLELCRGKTPSQKYLSPSLTHSHLSLRISTRE